MGFFYSFTETIIYSIWQAALLVVFYFIAVLLQKNIHPLQKRNLLYCLLFAQLLFSVFTFVVFANNIVFTSFSGLQQISNLGATLPFFVEKYFLYIFTVYVIVVAIKVAAIAFQWKRFNNGYSKNLIKPPVTLKLFAEQTAFKLGIKRKTTIWLSKHIHTPITFGFIKPLIILPFSLINSLSIKDAEAIIIHELTHVKYKDYLLNWFLMAMEIMYFFNPFIKILATHLRIEREKNCDIQVINFNYNIIDYAQSLLLIAENNYRLKHFQLGAVKKTSQLLHRIQFFSNHNKLSFTKINFGHLATLAIIPFLIILFVKAPQNNNLSSGKPSVTKTLFKNNVYELPISIPVNDNFETAEIPSLAVEKPINSSELKKPVLTINTPNNLYELETANPVYKAVAYNEANEDSVKQIIYNVETQNGKITQSYKLIQINGEWVLQLLWMLVETKADSTFRFDSTKYSTQLDSIQ